MPFVIVLSVPGLHHVISIVHLVLRMDCVVLRAATSKVTFVFCLLSATFNVVEVILKDVGESSVVYSLVQKSEIAVIYS